MIFNNSEDESTVFDGIEDLETDDFNIDSLLETHKVEE